MNLGSMANRVIDRCDSTNQIARQLGDHGYPHGTWVSARVQDAGRGRLGRKWESFEGNLFLSMIYRLQNRELWSWIPLVTAIGVTDALLCWNSRLEARIKWPNDLWIGSAPGAKLGGILCEAVGNRNDSYVVIGLGLNCLHAPSGLDQLTSSITAALTPFGVGQVSADDIREKIVRGLLDAFDELNSPIGLKALLSRYETRALFQLGTDVEWIQSLSGAVEHRVGIVQGLGNLGELIVKVNDSELLSLFAEDVKIRLKKSHP